MPSVDPFTAPATAAMLSIEERESRDASSDWSAQHAALPNPVGDDQRVER